MAETKNVIETKLYKGKVNVRFFPDSHQYWVDGKRKTGVTTYIGIKDKSRALVIWATELAKDHLLALKTINPDDIELACKLHSIKKEEAATIGDIAHTWIEQFVKGENPEMPEDSKVLIAINGFLDWVNANKVKFLSSERIVYSKKHDYIGKMDIEAKVNGKLCLIDIKTSSGLYNSYAMQTAAYVKADEEESGRKYEGRWLIRLSKETEVEYLKRMLKKGKKDSAPYVAFEAKYLDDEKGNMNRDYKAFINCKELYEWDKETDFWINK